MPQTMSRTTFQAVGAFLWGSRWRAEMARALDVDRRTITRWDVGDSPIPDYAIDQLRDLLADRRRTLDRLMAKTMV
jgi:hypothetical protein